MQHQSSVVARHGFRAGLPERLALVESLALVLFGVLVHRHPAWYPFGPDDRFADMSLIADVQVGAAASVLVLGGVVASLAALWLVLGRAASQQLLAAVVVVGVVVAVTFAYVVPDIQLLIVTAYSLTLSLPTVVAFVLVWRTLGRLGERLRPRARWWTAAAAGGAVLVATVGGLMVVAKPWTWNGGEGGDAVDLRPLLLLASALIGVSWALVALRAVRHLRHRCVRCGRPGAAWTAPEAAARWGRVVTWATALCPLPYVLTRLTWLTPWPYGESAETLADNPGLRVFGLGLAVAGEVGTWLTLSLIKPRGEVFPGWVPRLGGRTVPVMSAVVPGFSVALLMSLGGHSILQQAFGPGSTWEDHALVLLVPLPIWGPLLAASTLAYWYRRRPVCRSGQRSRSVMPSTSSAWSSCSSVSSPRST